MTLDPVQIKSVLQGLPEWQVEDGAHLPAQPEVHLQPDLVVVRVGDPVGTGVTPQDVELAAAIDRVPVGAARDKGS